PVARWIQLLPDDVLRVGEGSLYPALHRLEERGWVESEWQRSENNRKAKFYRLTGAGRAQLRAGARAGRGRGAPSAWRSGRCSGLRSSLREEAAAAPPARRVSPQRALRGRRRDRV